MAKKEYDIDEFITASEDSKLKEVLKVDTHTLKRVKEQGIKSFPKNKVFKYPKPTLKNTSEIDANQKEEFLNNSISRLFASISGLTNKLATERNSSKMERHRETLKRLIDKKILDKSNDNYKQANSIINKYLGDNKDVEVEEEIDKYLGDPIKEENK